MVEMSDPSCRSCGRNNRADAKFCLSCGAALANACPSCGRELPAGAGFCDGCGQRLAAGETSVVSSAPGAASGPAATLHARAASGAARADLPASFASGRYRVERFLGEGGKKRVHLAHDTRLNRKVALAFIKTEGLDDAGRARVQHEAQAMAQLGDHPNVVPVFDIGEEAGQIYIVSQFMGGGDLDARLAQVEERRLTLDESLRIAEQVCSGLEHSHARGVIHRDIKPGNVWLAEDGTAKIGDFGLALSIERSRLTQEGTIVGTVSYMSPEQALGRPPDPRSDLYSLGAMLYELVTGRPPFLGDDAVAIISQHINTAPVAPSWHNAKTPEGLERLILRLLRKNPDERPATAQLVLQGLQHARSVKPDTALPRERGVVNPLDRLAEGVFVGRDAELERLRSALEDSLSGHGRILMLVGEPGIGKTRISEELTTYAKMRGAQVLWGRCYEGDGAPAYWPWVQIIRAYVHDREPKELASEMGAGAADIAAVVSEVRDRLPGLPVSSTLEPEEARFRLFDSISTFLKNASRGKPLVVVLDDLHWSDKPSLLLLEFLAREFGDARLLVLGTYRDVELGRQHPLERSLAELARTGVSERVLLRGIRQEDVARFIELSAGKAAPARLVEAVYRETEGNPFFVHEVVHLLESDGRLVNPDSVESWSVEIPQGVRQVIGRRLSTLPPDCNEVLTIAAVVGREFDFAVLAQIAELSEDVVLDLIERAEDARIVEEMRDTVGRYRFTHALIRETLYEELRTTRRLRVHRRIANVIEERNADRLEPHLAELAYHFCEAATGGDIEKAIDYAVRAAERATLLLAHEEAANHYERAILALEAAEIVDEVRHCELLIALGRAQFLSGTPDQYPRTFWKAIGIARHAEQFELLGLAILGLAYIPMNLTGSMDIADVISETLAALPDEPTALRARLILQLAGEILYKDSDLSNALAHEAVSMAEALEDGDVPDIFHARADFLLSSRRNPEEHQKLVDKRVAFAIKANDEFKAFFALGARISCYSMLADADGIREDIAVLEGMTEILRTPHSQATLLDIKAAAALREGDLADARKFSWDGRTQRMRLSRTGADQLYGLFVFGIRWSQGRLAETLPVLEAGVAAYGENPIWPCLLSCAYAESGREAEARSLLEKMFGSEFDRVMKDTNLPFLMALLGDACWTLRHEQGASILIDHIGKFTGRYASFGTGLTAGSIDRVKALCYATLGRFDEAVAHFELAMQVDEEFRAWVWLPRTQCDFAAVLLERDGPGDDVRALGLLRKSLDASERLGLKGWLDRALALKLRVQGVDSRSVAHSIYVVAKSVGVNRPDLAAHSSPEGEVTLMLSDMQDFSEMTERLGDHAAREIVREHNRIIRGQLDTFDGHEVDTAGDGFLVAFKSPVDGVRCAVAIQRVLAARNDGAGEPIRIRIGLHTGEALKDADKFFGRTVILAARIGGAAGGGQILVSGLVRQLVAQVDDIRFGDSRSVELKGIAESQTVVDVLW